MFEHTAEPGKRSNSEILIKGVDGDILRQLIEYSDSDEEHAINSANVAELTRAATMLQFTKVLKRCTEFYLSILNVSNCVGIWEIADRHNIDELKKKAHEIIVDRFAEVSQGEEFNQLGVDQLSALFENR